MEKMSGGFKMKNITSIQLNMQNKADVTVILTSLIPILLKNTSFVTSIFFVNF